MKKILWVVVALLATLNVQAQHEEGTTTIQAKVGVNWASMTDYNQTKFGYNFGVEFEHYLSDQFSLSAAIMYSDQGAKDNEFDKVIFDVDYVNLPIMVSFYVAPEVIPGLAIKAGVQPGFRAKTTIKSAGYKIDVDQFLKNEFGIDSDLNKFMFSVPVGLAFEFRNVVLDARYIFGVTSLVKGENIRNNVIQLTLGYKFGGEF